MQNNVRLHIDHPNKVRMEYFLNRVKDKLNPVPFDWQDWKEASFVLGGFQFQNPDKTLTITVLFTDSYAKANDIAKANVLLRLPHAKWSVNGDLLYFVESKDENKVSTILGFFAGEE